MAKFLDDGGLAVVWVKVKEFCGGLMSASVYDPQGKATDVFKYADDAVEKHVLMADRSVYVSNDGSDETGDGTQENPWATIQKAVDEAPEESGAYTYEINVSIGSYAGFTVSGKRVHIYGATQGITITSKISVVDKGFVYVSPRLTFSPPDNGAGLSIYSCGYANIGHATFNNCQAGISVGDGGRLYVRRTTTLTFNNCASSGISVSSGGFACIMGTISGTGNKQNMSVSGGIISYGFYRADPGAEPDSVSKGGIIANNLLDVSQKGIAGGLATLDENGKVPEEQLPAMDYDPAGSAAAVDGKLTTHTGDTVKHITAAERTAWNAKETTAGAQAKADAARDAAKAASVPTGRKVNGRALSADISLTAADVGLGNVPNVGTNDQTPTFTQAASRANLVSGEKLSVLFGKLMKWFADLKAVAFSGSAADLTTGTLNSARLPTVPLSKGGTGGTTAAAARTALGALGAFAPVNITISATWSGTGPWTQNVAVGGVKASWDYRLGLHLAKITDDAARKLQEKAMMCIAWCETYDGGITLTCRDKKPDVAIQAVLSGEV